MAKIKEKLLFFASIGISIFVLLFFIGSVWIGHEAKSLCQNARWQYGGDCVQSLTELLEDENQNYRSRNHAIWALGQLGDIRALPILEKYYTGNIPKREPLDKMISQYELKKAIKLANGGANITAWLWRCPTSIF
jgi:hypothetical protein